ncbi:MAG: 3-methyl-2-oxobutanoate hydroxymethyltransferase [Gammaproteobacteria bacterium]|nr:MAG: 3-methyl-2-oxobutanoate hydroxymethyltransferase [Gammaproteobacteria bacterium]
MANVTISTLNKMKAEGEKFVCLTAYDATFSRLVSEAGAETILVGDSLGMVLQGHDSTIPVSVDDMAYHTACVARGNKGAMIIGDLPFMSYSNSVDALDNARTLMQAGAHMVKMEGGTWLSETISQLVECGIPVCAHLGLTPQSVNALGGYRVQGRTPKEAKSILADAVEIQDAGASLLVLECVPAHLASDIASKLDIPVIGIGAGAGTDAQVLVLYDMLGLSSHTAKFVRNFMEDQTTVEGAIKAFIAAVKDGSYPAPEHTYS